MTSQAQAAQAASGSSFYAGMRILPRAEREAMYAIYAYCRAVDDIADDQGRERAARDAALQQWREAIDALYRGGDAGLAEFLRPAVARFGLRRDDFEAVIDGMAMDVERDIRWPSMTELDLYCDRVASAVGRLSVRIFGMDAEPGEQLAHHLGRALQLTNILRDIDEDAAIGRVYLPAEALIAAGVALGDIGCVIADERIDIACRSVADRAQQHFLEASAIMAARPRGHLIAPRLMEAAYSRLLGKMLATGWRPPRDRIRHNKLALMWTLLRLKLAG
jgi:squalene synthase HpnD